MQRLLGAVARSMPYTYWYGHSSSVLGVRTVVTTTHFRCFDVPKGTGTAPSYTCRLAALQVPTGLRCWYHDLTFVTWFAGKRTKDFDTGCSPVPFLRWNTSIKQDPRQRLNSCWCSL